MAQDFLASGFLAPDIWDRMTQRLIIIWPRTVWTCDISTQHILAPDILAPDISAPDILAQDISAPDISAQGISAPDISAQDTSAQDILAQDISATSKLYCVILVSQRNVVIIEINVHFNFVMDLF